MRFSTTLLAVRDMERSLKFYKEIFNQDVVLDFGDNKTLDCGLCLQQNFDSLADFDKNKMQFKTYNMELYFETEDIDSFLALLAKHPEVERLHEAKTHSWQQRVIRIFDPDGHIIEVGESMRTVAYRQFDKGFSAEKVAEITQHPIELIKKWLEEYKKDLQ